MHKANRVGITSIVVFSHIYYDFNANMYVNNDSFKRISIKYIAKR